MKYQRKRQIVDAEQWFPGSKTELAKKYIREVVRKINSAECLHCNKSLNDHGLYAGLDQTDFAKNKSLRICPGMWILTHSGGGRSVYSQDYFDEHFEPFQSEPTADHCPLCTCEECTVTIRTTGD